MDRPYIGGQAVLEGVMMRSPKSFVVAVRRPDGSIAVREQPWNQLLAGLPFLRWPLLRGALVLLESLHNGYSALAFSADQALPPEEKEKAGAQASTSWVLAFATVLMVAVFIATPHLVTYGLSRVVPALDPNGFWFHAVDGVIRLVILLGYIFAISKTKDAQRLFEYHGAEHKAIWTYESNQALTVENARRFSTLHPRCGTSFLFVVVMVAVLVHVAVLPLLPTLHPVALVNQLLMVVIKIGLAFPIAGIAYEFQRLSARPSCPRVLTYLARPGIWLQNVTTQEPSDAQLEIALLALQRALAREQGQTQAQGGVQIYADFERAQAA